MTTTASHTVNRVQYHAVLREPEATAEAVAEFLELPLDVEAMTGQVDGSLYRQRRVSQCGDMHSPALAGSKQLFN